MEGKQKQSKNIQGSIVKFAKYGKNVKTFENIPPKNYYPTYLQTL